MKVGIIAPIKFLEKYCKTSIQYCLPCLIVNEPEYRHFYAKRASMGNTIILDCRQIGWKREPEKLSVVEESLHYLTPSIVISPSCMFNSRRTRGIQEEFVYSFPQLRGKLIRCIEGTSEEEMERIRDKDRVAAPAHMYKYISNLRLNSHTIYIDNHLNLDELHGKEGILVTSLPIRLGLQGRLLSDYKPAPPSLTFYEELDYYSKVTERNVAETIEYYED